MKAHPRNSPCRKSGVRRSHPDNGFPAPGRDNSNRPSLPDRDDEGAPTTTIRSPVTGAATAPTRMGCRAGRAIRQRVAVGQEDGTAPDPLVLTHPLSR